MRQAARILGPLVLLAASLPAWATIVLEIDLFQLVGRSDLIFVAEATGSRSHWGEDGRHIVTDTTFTLSRPIKGNPGGQVIVRNLGGVVGGMGMRVSGMPSFASGEEVLLFTEMRQGQRYVVGLEQGVYRLSRDGAGRATVQPRLGGLTLARRTPEQRLQLLRGRRPPAPRALEQFVAEIRQAIARCTREPDRCR